MSTSSLSPRVVERIPLLYVLLILVMTIVAPLVLGGNQWQVVLVGFLMFTSFIVTFGLTPWISSHLLKIGISGIDRQKTKRIELAEMGGLSVSAGLIFGLLCVVFLSVYLKNTFYSNQTSMVMTTQELIIGLLAAISTILTITIVGIADDLFQLPQYVKALLPIIAAFPLMVILAGKHDMSFPFIGSVGLGLVYSLVFIPLGVTGASNAVNMFAGLNGLEASLGIVMHLTVLATSLLILPFTPEAIYATIISASMLGALIAFLHYNRYPSKVFPGDVMTLTIGGSLATAVILGNMEKIGLILLAPHFIELFLKARTRFKGQSFGIPQKDGTLKAPKNICSLNHVPMRLWKLTEPQVVAVLVLFECIFAAGAFLSVYLTHYAPHLIL